VSVFGATGPTFESCGDVHLVFARGSGLDPGDEDFEAVDRLLGDEIAADSKIYSAYELGETVGSRTGYEGFVYPAIGSEPELVKALVDRVPFHDWVTA
jgi:hypothetical protein